MISIVN